jgi:GxxExxY protein
MLYACEKFPHFLPQSRFNRNRPGILAVQQGPMFAARRLMPEAPDQSALNALSYQIIAAAIEIHSKLGPGLLESVYRTCMIHELRSAGMHVAAEKSVPIYYKGEILDGCYRIDVLVNDSIILELKAVDQILPVHRAQLLSYLRLTGKPLGLVINFHVPKLVEGVCRMINSPGFGPWAK